MTEKHSEGLAGLLSAMLTQYAALQSADNAVDGKANNLMAAALVIIPLVGTLLMDGSWHWLIIGSMAIMISTVLLVLFLTRSRQYASAVVDIGQHPEYFAKENILLLAQLTEDTAQANATNAVILDEKQRLFRYAMGVFLFGFGLSILSLFLAR